MAQPDEICTAPPLSGTSEETIARLERLKSLHPKIIDLSLGRIERLLGSLGHPERSLPPVIHVAGTNGKGSVIGFLRAILESAGLRVHVYTSPHLIRFNERIRLAGTLVDTSTLCQVLEDCERANEDQPITFFEATTAAAYLAFSRVPADIVLLETGLGGRLDATNVIDHPAVTAITAIGLDHQQFLGEDLTSIANEKAGILKPGSPAVVARQADDANAAIVAHAREMGAPLITEGDTWHVRLSEDRLIYEDDEGVLDLPTPALAGPHQVQNAGVAIACVRALTDFTVPLTALAQGLTTVQWPGRLQRLRGGPLTQNLPQGTELWLDGGHNELAGRALSTTVAAMTPERPLVLIMGMLTTKDVGAFLHPFKNSVAKVHAVPVPDEPAGLAPEVLVARAKKVGIAAVAHQSVTEALNTVKQAKTPETQRIVICGSLYLAGCVLSDNGMGESVK